MIKTATIPYAEFSEKHKGEEPKMQEQMNLFDMISSARALLNPGEFVEGERKGRKLSFLEIETLMIGKTAVMDASTQSHEWYKVIRIERVFRKDDGVMRLQYFDGNKQRGFVDETHFDESRNYPARIWKLV